VPKYTGFNAIIKSLDTPNFTVLGFPCNQFGNQEPGANDEILNTLQYVRPGSGFVPAFDLTQIVDVNGAFADPIWTALRGDCPSPDVIISNGPPLWNPISTTDVQWNFQQILIGKSGRPYRRYDTLTAPSAIVPDIEYLLSM